LNSKSIKLKKSVMFTKIAPQFRKVIYKMDTPGSEIAPRLVADHLGPSPMGPYQRFFSGRGR
jgi:hypothetical protein